MSDARPRGFASDNSAGVHPSVLTAIAAVNDGHVLAYGHDPYTQEIERRVAAQFGERAQAFFVFNGSAANVLSLRAACRPWQGAICADSAHVNVDECGAPESVGGVKLLTVPAARRQADARAGRALDRPDRRRARRAATGADRLAVDRAGHAVPNRTSCGRSPRSPMNTGCLLHVDGSRLDQRRGGARRLAGRGEHRRGRRHRLVRRHQEEWAAGRRGGRICPAGPGRRASSTSAS